jgi:shikimate dehydrogenase
VCTLLLLTTPQTVILRRGIVKNSALTKLLHRVKDCCPVASVHLMAPGGDRSRMSEAEKFKVAGIIGWPVSHSRSPKLHGYWLRRYNISGAYLPLPVQVQHLETALRGLAALGFAGGNVTIPHKEEAARLVDRIDPIATRVGAVNTIVVQPDGLLSGTNTDGYGFIENLREAMPGWHADAAPTIVLGAGGAARSVLASLIDAGAREIRLINRTRSRAEQLAHSFGGPLRIVEWNERHAALADGALLVNTTNLGMVGQPALELALHDLPRTAVVYDLVYNPLQTALLRAAQTRGNPAVDGLGMLLHQARPGFQAWFGVLPDITPELRATIEATLR